MALPHYRWPPGLRTAILTRDRHTCQLRYPGCTTHATHLDHITPISQGGRWFDPTNLQAACQHCNISKHNKPTRPPTPQPSRTW